MDKTSKPVCSTTQMVIPHMESLLGIDLLPKPKWMPNWIWKLKERRQRENAIMQFKPVHYKPTKEQVAIMIAQELRDFAERILGYSHIDPEKSSIPRSNRRVNGDRWMGNFKYEPPKQKKLSPRYERRILRKALRKALRKTDRQLEEWV